MLIDLIIPVAVGAMAMYLLARNALRERGRSRRANDLVRERAVITPPLKRA